MTKKLFRIAIFECDTPVDAVHAKRGSYGDIFQDLLTQSLHLVGKSHGDLSLEVTKWDVVHSMSYPDLSEEKVDAILLTGSSKFTKGMNKTSTYNKQNIQRSTTMTGLFL